MQKIGSHGNRGGVIGLDGAGQGPGAAGVYIYMQVYIYMLRAICVILRAMTRDGFSPLKCM